MASKLESICNCALKEPTRGTKLGKKREEVRQIPANDNPKQS